MLVAALDEPDGFLRFKVIAALERLRRSDAPLAFPKERLETEALREGAHFFNYLSLHSNLFGRKSIESDLLSRTLDQKMERTRDRVYRLLALIYPWRDIGAAQWTLAHGDARSRASASEYLDNILTGQLRKRIMPVLEDLPADERVRRGNVLLKTRPRDQEYTLLHLINDDDQVVAAVAIDVVRQHQMWTLGDDIEHVLAHGTPTVLRLQTASGLGRAHADRSTPRALARATHRGNRLAARCRSLRRSAWTAVQAGQRVATVRHQPGTVLLRRGRAETIHVLIDGRVTSKRDEVVPGNDRSPRDARVVHALGRRRAEHHRTSTQPSRWR